MDHRSHNNEPEPLHPCLLPDHAYILRRVTCGHTLDDQADKYFPDRL